MDLSRLYPNMRMITLITKQEVAILHYIVLHYITLHYTILHYILWNEQYVSYLPVKPYGTPAPKQKRYCSWSCNQFISAFLLLIIGKQEIDIDILGLYLFIKYVDLCNHIINKQKLFKIYYYSYLKSCCENLGGNFILCQKQHIVMAPLRHTKESKKSSWSVFFSHCFH